MRIGIDATSVWKIKEGQLSGMTNYAVHTIKNMITMDTDHEYVIYGRKEIQHHLNTDSLSVTFRFFNSMWRKVLQQTALPLWALFDRVDVMFFPVQATPFFCPCNSVVTIHDLHPYVVPERFAKVHSSEMHGHSLKAIMNQIYWRKMLRIASERADRIIAVSQTTKDDIEKIFNLPSEKIEMIHEGVDKDQFNLDRDEEKLHLCREEFTLPEKYILCVGTHAYKNTEGSIRAFGLVKKKYGDNLKLVMVGNKQFLSRHIFALIEELHLEDQVQFLGFVPDDRLKCLYQCAEMLLFPSFYEGFGLPVLEAYACGIPVVTSNMGSLPEIAGEAGVLVDPNDPEDIASSVRTLLTDEAYKAKKCQQGIDQVAKFSWKDAGRKTLEVIEKVFAEE